MGDLTKADHAPLVRLHSSCFTGDLIDSLRCDCGDQLHQALRQISEEQCGVLVYLPQEGRGIGLAEKIKAMPCRIKALIQSRRIWHSATKLIRATMDRDSTAQGLGLQQVRLLTNNPKKTEAFVFGGFDLTVVDQVAIVPPIHEHNAKYLATKRDKMGHQLPKE